MHGHTFGHATPCSSCCGDVFGDRRDVISDEGNDMDDVIGDRDDVDVIDDRNYLIMQTA